jgi:hypothetical protein
MRSFQECGKFHVCNINGTDSAKNNNYYNNDNNYLQVFLYIHMKNLTGKYKEIKNFIMKDSFIVLIFSVNVVLLAENFKIAARRLFLFLYFKYIN